MADACWLHPLIDDGTFLLLVLPVVVFSGLWRYLVPTVLEPDGGTPMGDFPQEEGVTEDEMVEYHH